MSDMLRNDDEHVSPDNVEGAHDADGTLGRTAGTGAGAISGGVVGMALGGPVGAVVGAVAGAVLGHAGGDAAHDIGDDHDDVNVETGSGGDLGKNAGMGAGALSGAAVGTVAAGPVGTVAGAVAGGMLGAAAGDAAKDVGGDDRAGYGNSGHATDRVAQTDYSTANVPGGRVAATGSVGDLTAGNEFASVHTGDTGETVRLHEERLEANKQQVQTGEVAIRKEVVTEQKTIEVPVTREEVIIERHPVSGVEASDFVAEGQEIRIPVSEEQVTVTKTPVVTEEVSIGKRTVQDTQHVSDTVRREEARIEQTGATRVSGDMAGVQTGGVTTAGQDTRGLTEKAADAVTGDRTDDNTGGRVL